jgi:hypothetical protein
MEAPFCDEGILVDDFCAEDCCLLSLVSSSGIRSEVYTSRCLALSRS